MAINGSEHDTDETPAPSQVTERALGALWTLTVLLWLLAGCLALHLRAPAPPYYNFALTLASVMLVVATVVTMFHGSRRTYRAALARIHAEVAEVREQQAQRDAAWSTLNALLGGTDTNLRVLPRVNSDRN